MIAIENVLVAIALTVICTTVHQGTVYGNECVDLLSEEFQKGHDNKATNFQKAYAQLSINTINNKFKIEIGDTLETINRKIRQYDVTIGYFLDLVNNRKLRAQKMNFPQQWCKEKVNEDAEKEKINFAAVEHHMKMCEEYTLGYLFDNAENLSKDAMFQILYTYWTKQNILDKINSCANISTNLTLGIDMTAYYIENYSLGYFCHFEEEYVNDKRHNIGFFKSIETYCGYVD